MMGEIEAQHVYTRSDQAVGASADAEQMASAFDKMAIQEKEDIGLQIYTFLTWCLKHLFWNGKYLNS